MLRGILLSFIQPVGRRVYIDAIKSVISWKLLSLKHLSRCGSFSRYLEPLRSILFRFGRSCHTAQIHRRNKTD
ncbi:hypothetical protein Tsubulata_019484 [Turnera subulata]|uniref:Uncharacterized protein n=1 Tax=Turnera subulata TaxID=218843 RepID=A0A9Q0IWZ5_9ROSI|nr:hypothetical protein Tsubulata_019484 [Turnera subulata]